MTRSSVEEGTDSGHSESKMEDKQSGDMCRVCRSEGSPDKPLYHPCVCTGSIKYIHQDCLVQWLKYSKKEYCELCKHRYTFTPIYAPDMPKRLPIHDILTGLARGMARAIRYWLHYTLVAVAWLGIVPLTACRMYRCLFTGSINSVLTLPLDMLSTENLVMDCFQGCFVVTCTLCTFISLVWLREQILHGGGPDWLDQDQPPANHRQNAAAVPRRARNAARGAAAEVAAAGEPAVVELAAAEPAGAGVAVANGGMGDAEAAAAGVVGGDDEAEEGDDESDDGEDEVEGANPQAVQEENIWNPIEWDRAAEELTWERLLGLDGSLLFLEHVFWVVSLNTLFIVIFAFCPYHIGHISSTALKLDELMSASQFDGVLLTLLGYTVIAMALVTLHFISSIARLKKARRVLGLCYVAVKVSLLVVTEIGLFPLTCGVWLDICSLNMFDATLKDREHNFRLAPGTSLFIHWLVGMVYIFYFASFILLLREVLRPGLLWFLRNINDPDFNPIQEMIHLSVYRHLRRFIASMVVFGSIVLIMLWLPIQLIRKIFPTFLPFHVMLSSDTPVSELSLELLLLQVVLPALLEQGHTRQWLKSLIRSWCLVVAWLLDLRSYLLGDISLEETTNQQEEQQQEQQQEEQQQHQQEEQGQDTEDMADNTTDVPVMGQVTDLATDHTESGEVELVAMEMECVAMEAELVARERETVTVNKDVCEVNALVDPEHTSEHYSSQVIECILPDSESGCQQLDHVSELGQVSELGKVSEWGRGDSAKDQKDLIRPPSDPGETEELGGLRSDLVRVTKCNLLLNHDRQNDAEEEFKGESGHNAASCRLEAECSAVNHCDRQAGGSLLGSTEESGSRVDHQSGVNLDHSDPNPSDHANPDPIPPDPGHPDPLVLGHAEDVVRVPQIQPPVDVQPIPEPAQGAPPVQPAQPVNLGDAHQAMLLAGGPVGFQPYKVPQMFAVRLLCLVVLMCITLFLASFVSFILPVFVGRRLMGLWTGELKVHELYTAACGLYTCWVLLRVAMVLYTWIPQGGQAILNKILEWTLLVSKTLFIAVVLIGVVPLMLGLIFELVIVLPIRVPLDQTPVFFPWQDWALGVLHAKIITAATMMGPQWRLKRVIEQVYNQGLRNMDMKLIVRELCLPILVCLGLLLALPTILTKSILPAIGADFETQNLVHRRIYPCLLGVLLFVSFCIFQARQFRRLYEHIKNDKYLVGQRLVNYERHTTAATATTTTTTTTTAQL